MAMLADVLVKDNLRAIYKIMKDFFSVLIQF